VKLHLGCGQRYLEGYVNIDFPISEHTVQQDSVADLHADILGLRYPVSSVEEIRLHHVFEHFPRPVACALLASWYSWLCPGGTLHIEVPDLRRTALVLSSSFSSFKARAVAERHLFGSHEAAWAAHLEGYSPRSLRVMLKWFGFKTWRIRRNSWRGTYNFELFATKAPAVLSREALAQAASGYLESFLLDRSPSELSLHDVWMEGYRRQAERSWATDA
jgi:hypothetical protein